ncbi:MAG: hypothetical protein ACRDGH_04555 [Candidatus Limnocylindria bacterium]
MSDTTTEQPTEPQPGHQDDPELLALAEARRFAKRVQRRNAELEHLPAEVAGLKRQLGLARAQVDPDSWLGQTVATAAAADGIDDPDQVVNLVRVISAELNRDRGRQMEE